MSYWDIERLGDEAEREDSREDDDPETVEDLIAQRDAWHDEAGDLRTQRDELTEQRGKARGVIAECYELLTELQRYLLFSSWPDSTYQRVLRTRESIREFSEQEGN